MRLLEKLIEATLGTKWWPIISLASLLVTILVLSIVLGVRCAVCMTGALFAHEMGHYLMLRKYEVPCAMPFLRIVDGGVPSYYYTGLRPSAVAWIKTAGPWGGMLCLFALLMLYEVDPLWARPILFTGFVFGIGSLLDLLPTKTYDGRTLFQVIFTGAHQDASEQESIVIRIAWALHLGMTAMFAIGLVYISYMLAQYKNIWLILPGII